MNSDHRRRRAFDLEGLEPRLLLSADGIASVDLSNRVMDPFHSFGSAETVMFVQAESAAAEKTEAPNDLFSGIADEPLSGPADNSGPIAVAPVTAVEPEIAVVESRADAGQTVVDTAVGLVVGLTTTAATTLGNTALAGQSDTLSDQLTTTLTAANGPPGQDLTIAGFGAESTVSSASSTKSTARAGVGSSYSDFGGSADEFAPARAALDPAKTYTLGALSITTVTAPDFTQLSNLFNGSGVSFTFAGTIQIDGFFALSGTFTITAPTAQTVTVATGLTSHPTPITGVAVSTWSIAATGVHAFVGVGGPDRTDTNNDGLINASDPVNPEAVGLAIDGLSIGLVIMKTTSGIVNPVTTLPEAHSFYAVKATASFAGLVGMTSFVEAAASVIAVSVNTGNAWLGSLTVPVVNFALTNFGAGVGAGYTIPTTSIVIDFADRRLAASAGNVLLRISDFVFVSGGLSISKGPVQLVDVRTGLTSLQATVPLAELPVAADGSGTTLGKKADGSMIWNLPVETLDFGLNGVDVFVGYTNSLTAASADGDLTLVELAGVNAIGVFLDEVSLGMTVMRAVPDLSKPVLTSAQLRFVALKVDAANVALVGVPELTLSANNLQVRFNQGSALGWPTSVTGPSPVVDFALSFAGGYSVQTSTSTSIALQWSQPLIGVSADNVLFRVSDFVYISGGFSFNKGPVVAVDVRTGLTTAQATTALSGVPTLGSDNGTFGRNASGSLLYNLPVETLEFGLSNVDVFVGYTDSLNAAAANGDLTAAELISANAVGVFLDEVNLGMVLMRSLPPITAVGLTAAQLRFFAMQVDAGGMQLLGIPEFTLSTTNLQVRVNQGSFVPAAWPVVPGVGAPPVVDFKLSFPDTVSDPDSLPDGYQVQTSTSGPTLALRWEQPLIGVSADNVLLKISDFVYVSGGFSFNKGPVKNVDVRTGLTLTTLQATGLFGGIATSETDPVAGTLARKGDGSMIWNLPVQTLDFGLSAVDVFVGYTDSLNAAAADGNLTTAELNAANAIGVFLDNVDLGMVMMQALPVASAGTLNAAMLKFFALKVDATNVALLGVPEFWLSANNLQVRLNQGSFMPGTWGTSVAGINPPPVVDFTLSFPDNSWDSSNPDGDALPDGYQVQTSTSNPTPVKLLWNQPLIGVSADNVLFRISDFVYVSGGFSFNKGPVKNVDVRTGLTLTTPQAFALFGGISTSETDPVGGTLARKGDGSMIWNLPVQTLDFGLSAVDVFVGYTNSLDAAAADGNLTTTELNAANAIGVFLDNVDMGMVMMQALPVLGAGTMNAAMLKFFALKVDAANVALIGVPELWLSANNLQVRLNQGSFTPGTWGTSVAGISPPPVVDFTQSFPDNSWSPTTPDGDSLPDGYQVQTSTSNPTPVKLLWSQPLIGVSADNVLFRVSDFVYVSGAFSFNKGPVKKVDVRTGLTLSGPEALLVFGTMTTSESDPGGGALARKGDGSMIWNLPVQTLDFGLSAVDVFVGYTDSLDAAAADGNLTTAELNAANAIGVFLDNVDLGMVMMQAMPVVGAGTMNAAMLKFFAMKIDAANVALLGVPELWLSANNLQVRLNQGSFTPGTWGTNVAGINPPPVVDFALSFPDNSWDPTNPDGDSLADGYQVQTSTSNPTPVKLLWDSPLIGVSADNVLLRISDFVYVTGSFSFNKGPVKKVDVRTGLNGVQAAITLAGVAQSDTDPGSTVARKSDGSILWNLPVETLDLGLSNVDVFVGYTASLDAAAADGNLSLAELQSAKAIGVFLDNVNFGMVMMRAQTVSGAPLLNAAQLKFFAIEANALNLGLVGVPEIQLLAQGAQVHVNQGSFTPGMWSTNVAGVNPPPFVDFALSFPDNSWDPTNPDVDSLPDGYRVATNTSGSYIAMLFDQPLIAGGAEKVTIQISQFVYLTGSIYFEKGPVMTVPLVAGLAGDPSSLGIPVEFGGTGNKQIQTMTIGATNVNAFVGLNGPYWKDSTTGPFANGLIDRDVGGNIITAEVNTRATGLVIDNLNFGLFIGTPTSALDPMRYVALKATAQQIALVGIEGMTASANGIIVELNLSSPTLSGFPVLPVINFSGMPGGKFGVKTGAKDGFGNDVTIDLTMSTALIRAQGFINLNIFNSVYLSGSVAFELGPTKTVTLSNGATKTVTTMSIGIANVNAFIGFNGPYWNDLNGNKSVDPGELSTTAVGFAIADFDAGLLVMASTNPLDLGAYVALKASVTSFGLVNMPAGLVATGTFDIAINLGVGTSGLAAVNFVTSFPATVSPAAPAGYKVNTGDASSYVLLNFTGPQLNIQLGGQLSFSSLFNLTGVFLFEMNTGGLKVFADSALTIGPSGSFFNFHALGVLIINSQGVAADIEVALSLGAGMSDMTMAAVTARLIFNTSGVQQSVTIPEKYLGFLSPTATSRLIDGPSGSKYYIVAAGAPRLDGTTAPAGSYLVVKFNATIRILGFDFVGSFQMVADPTQFQLSADATLNVDLAGTTIFRFVVKGDLLINSSGRIAAGINLQLASGFSMPSSFGLTWGVTFQLRLNTGSDVTLPGVGLVENGFRIRASGTLGVPGLNLVGSFDLTVASDRFTVKVDASVTIFGTSLSVSGFAGLYYDSHPGFALSLQLTLGSNPTASVSPFAGFTISGSFILSINTSSVAREGIAPSSFTIGVTNLNVNLFGFTLTGSLIISISAAGLSIDIPAPGITLDFFGVVVLNVTGYLHTDGQFSFTASATVTFLDPDIFGFTGTVAVSFSNTGFSGYISATFGAFGIKVSGFGYFSIDNGIVTIAVGISLQITPAFSFKVWTPWKTYTVHVPALVISGTWRYTFGALTTATVVPPPPTLATKDGSNLRLNIGADAIYRGAAYPAGDESYTITKIAPDTIRVAALGYQQDFTGITHIVANDTGNSNNFISIANDITATVAINVGKTVTGTNRFFTGGGFATVQGGSVSTTVEFGSGGGSFIAGSGQSDIKDKSAGLVTVYAPGWTNYNLSDKSLNYGDGASILHTITFTNVKKVILNGAANAVYETSSLPDPDTGIVSRWTGTATFNGAGAASTVRASTATSLTLSNAALTESGVTITLTNLALAELYGNGGANTFTVSNWTGGGQIDGQGGTDTLVAVSDANFTLTNTSLARSGHGTLTLSEIEVATLTGGDSANTFTVSNWTGTANLNGVGAADTYIVNLVGSGSGTFNVSDTGLSGNDTLTINGTSAADVFVVSGLQVTRASETVNYSGLEALTINGLAGDDSFTLNSTSIPTTINGGNDDDTFVVNTSAATLNLNGEGGADSFTVNAAAAAFALTGGSENDTFRIRALSADSSINTGAGTNLIHLGTADYPTLGHVNNIAGKLTIVGGGTDTLNVNDTSDSAANTGLLTSSRLTGLGMGDDTKGIDYASIETLLIGLGTGGNTFNVRSTSNETITSLYTGSGSATVNVGSAAPGTGGNANGMGGRLNVFGQGSNDILNVDDRSDASANTGLLTSTRLTGLGMGGANDGIEYTNVEALNISLGTGSDTFNIQSTFDGTLTTLNTGLGSGSNTVNLGSLAPLTNGDVNAIAGKVIVNGQSSSDTINVDDTADTTANSGLLTGTRLTGLGMGDATKGLQYSTVEVLNVNLGTGADSFVVSSTHAGLTTVSTGGGNDQVNIASVSGETRIRGGAGDDDIKVNVDAVGAERLDGSGATINGVGALLDLDGQLGSDTYTAYLAGSPYSASHAVSVINVHDTGGSGNGTNFLQIYGSNSETLADNFLIRRNFIALMPPVPAGGTPTAERVNYDDTLNAGVAIYGRDGNDYFSFDDNSAAMTVDGGEGSDTFQIGQMFQSPRVAPNVASGDEVTTVHTTQGYLTPGVRFATTIYGGNGNDQFIVFSNQGPLGLFGEDGNDRFTVRAFALYGSEAVDPNRAGTNIDAGLGADYVEYNVNAPVAIDGGDGLDSLVVVGTEFSDRFVITADGIYGAGLFVTYTGIELIEVDGAEGNDHFSILSTPAGVALRIFGGLGSDTFDVGGQGGAVVSRDLEGHSGLIENIVVSSDVAYSGTVAAGVAVDVADKNAAGVVITQSGGATVVAEIDFGIGLRIDSYTVVLTAPPTSDVYITVSAPVASLVDQAAGSRSVQVYTDTPDAPAAYKTPSRAIELKFTPANWNQPQTVFVQAENDSAAEGTRYALIQHSIPTQSAPAGYAGLVLPNVAVKIIDDDKASAQLLPLDGSTLAGLRIGTLNPILEGTTGLSSQSFALLLTKAPAAGELVTVSVNGGTQLAVTGSSSFVFGTGSLSSAQAQLVTVRASDDGAVEGFHHGLVTATVSSTGATYTAAASIQLEVPIADTNSASVLVLQSNGSTRVIEGGSAVAGAPWNDTYSVALTQAPAAGQTVSIRILATPTPTTNAQLIALTQGAAANPAVLASIVPQVSVSSTAPGATTQVIGGKTYLVLTFDASNWSTPQVVKVAGIDDGTVDGGDIQAFGRTLQTLDGIRGPLSIEGGIDPTADRTLPPPLMYFGETNPSTHVAPPNPNFSAIESDQIDSLWVRNNNAIAAQSGVLTNSRLTGLGMGSDVVIAAQTFAGGITYSNLEMISVFLGTGVDTFEVLNTHGGETLIDSGGGNDVVTVRTVLGHTTILGGAGNDQITLGTSGGSALTIDRLRALVTVDGGAGDDTVTIDDRADTNNNVVTIDKTTVSGLDLIEARVRIVEIRNALPGNFTLTVDGLTTAALALSATDAEVRTALLALALPGVSDLVVNRASNTFTLAFLGDENLAAGALAVTGNASGLGPTAQIIVTNSAVNRVQNIALPAASGTYSVTIGSGGPSFAVTVGDTADTVRNAIVAAMNPTQAAGGVGVKDVLVARYGETYQVVFQGLLSGSRGAPHTFIVAPRATATATTFSLNAIGGSFRLNLTGASAQTSPLAWNASAAEVEGALRGLLGSSAITVAKSGTTFTINFGAVASSLASVDDRNLVAPVAVENRNSGVNYYGVDTLNLQLGAGSDVVNLRGTTAITNLSANNGDDRVYVSSLAAETLASVATTDFLRGNLDRILGTLNLDLGTGRHLLMVSDEAALAGDGTLAAPVRITDQPVSGLGLPATEITITGLTPAPALTYRAASTGNFADGITIWTGWGADTIVVDGAHQRGSGSLGALRTVTTLNTGLGNDHVTVTLNAADGFFVLNTQGPENAYAGLLGDVDTVDASASTRSLVIFGGQDDDTIRGGQGDDIIFGDRGLITYYNGSTAVTVLGNGGPGDRTDGVERPLGFITTVAPAVGGNDNVFGLEGRDIVFGGFGNDALDASASDVADDILIGDNGQALFTNGIITQVDTTSTSLGGNDTLTAGKGANIAFGGVGDDTILAGGDNLRDILVGDNGTAKFDPANGRLLEIFTTAPGDAGRDVLTTGDGSSVVFGGSFSDLITTGTGDDVIVGDNGRAVFDPSTYRLVSLATSSPEQTTGSGRVVGAVTYDDVISAGSGNNVIFGGSHSDHITTLGGADLVVGDNGTATFDATGYVRLVETTAPDHGGNDRILTGTGADIVLAGSGSDYVDSGSEALGDVSRDIVVGDNARAEFDASGRLVFVTTTVPATGGNDTILIGGGDNVALGGVGDDSITAGSGHDVIVGDNGSARFDLATLTLINIQTSDPTNGGSDTITASAGNNVVLGGSDIDYITTLGGADLVVGDNGTATFDATGYVRLIETTAPDQGGNDHILTGTGADIVLAGSGSDYVDSGSEALGDVSRDIVVGDNGRAEFDASGRLVFVTTTVPATGGNDTILIGGGDNVALGGVGDDSITAGSGHDVIVGDNGSARFDLVALTLINVQTSDSTNGGSDTITAGDGHNIVIGGSAADTITTGSGDDIVLGDNGYVDFVVRDSNSTDIDVIASTDFAIGGADTIKTGEGSDIVIAGQGADDVEAGNGNNLVIGDNGFITASTANFSRFSNQPISLGRIESIAFGVGGADTITSGTGNDFILGGHEGDTISAGDGDNVVLGDDGAMEFTRIDRDGATTGADLDPSDIDLIASLSTTNAGGADTITTGSGNDIILGGRFGDSITAGGGADLVIGDSGVVTASDDNLPRFGSQAITLGVVATLTPNDGAADTVNAGAGNDFILGGAGADLVNGQAGDDVIFGDHATLSFAGGLLVRGETIDNAIGGADTLRGDDGNDVLIGGAYGDRIDGGTGDDLVVGDNAVIDRSGRVGNGTSLLYQTLTGTLIYDIYGNVLVTDQPRSRPGGSPVWADFVLTLLDHSFAEQTANTSRFGDDYLAGGAGGDRLFGGLGNDTIQGDGSIDLAVSAARLADGTLQVSGSVEAATDGDDYIEGNGGNDTIFGGLGQDDIIGGSSNLFGLTTRLLRPDGSDFIFGGAGTDVARQDAGDVTANGRARDADTIAGDNAAIYRLVSATGSYLTFGYDNYGTLKIIPRAVEVLDYTPGGVDLNAASAANDIGASDEIHGESGNDTIYGQLGNDVLFGEGQDDDLIGGVGADWISGGNGDDGVLGDDGLIYTSRNGTAEPLYGIAAVPPGGLNDVISTPGNMQQATINVAGALKKTAILEPFMLEDSETVAGVTPSNDIIFGGLGDDFLHGGAGDDAISGAEALPAYYAKPYNPGDILRWGLAGRAGEFAAYNEYRPLEKIYVNAAGEFVSATTPGAVEFILNFVAAEQDGNDVIFGDVGNDWLVGGMGRDHIYGGYGDDLLNGDDNQDTAGGLNNVPDGPDANQEDIAYGGAGRDILIGNTGGDRLIDWAGEFNSYLVPFAPFGAATISRALQPQLMEYLYALSASDGADPTRAAKTGSAAARNGEPEGELGLVRQQDFDWGSQTGAPDDPQPGNVPGGRRDVLRSANFNSGTADGFSADSGIWGIVGGRLQVSPTAVGGDAVSVFYVDSVLPRYYEVQATINAVKPTAGYKANAYVIFDYQSPTDFKFAGVDVSTNKIVIGHRTAAGWIVDAQKNMQLKDGQDYNILLSVNGLTATMVVDNSNSNVLSFAFQPRVVDGYSYNLNTGMVGVGGNNSRAQIDNVAVQVLPPTITFTNTENFADGRANLLTAAPVGAWTVSTAGAAGTSAATTGFAASNFNLGLSASSLLLFDSTVKAGAAGTSAGIVFDYYDAENFKFAAIVAGTNQVVIGHHTKAGWSIDATAARTITPGSTYQLSVSLKGTTVSVMVGTSATTLQASVAAVFNSVVTDGSAGLFTRSGTATFSSYTVKTDDAKFTAATAATTSSMVALETATTSVQSAASGSVELSALSLNDDFFTDAVMGTASLTISSGTALSHQVSLGFSGRISDRDSR